MAHKAHREVLWADPINRAEKEAVVATVRKLAERLFDGPYPEMAADRLAVRALLHYVCALGELTIEQQVFAAEVVSHLPEVSDRVSPIEKDYGVFGGLEKLERSLRYEA